MNNETQVRLNNYISDISRVDKKDLEKEIDAYNKSVDLEGISPSLNNYILNKKNIFSFIDNAFKLADDLGPIDLSSEECFFHNTLPSIDLKSIQNTQWVSLFSDDPYNSMKVLAVPYKKENLELIENENLLKLDQLKSKFSTLTKEEASLRKKADDHERLRENLNEQGMIDLKTFIVLRTLTKISTLKLSQDPTNEALISEYKARNNQMSELNVIPFSGMPN